MGSWIVALSLWRVWLCSDVGEVFMLRRIANFCELAVKVTVSKLKDFFTGDNLRPNSG
jgi:hypothetical protein